MYTNIANFENQAGGNFGGGYALLFCPREYLTKPVASFVDPATGQISADFLNTIIAPPNLQKIFKPILTPESLQYIEKQTAADQGSFINVQIKATILKDTVQNMLSIEAMRFHEFVVFYQGQNYENDYWKVIGEKDKGMHFTAEFTSGESLKGSAAWQITFALNCRYTPAVGYFPNL